MSLFICLPVFVFAHLLADRIDCIQECVLCHTLPRPSRANDHQPMPDHDSLLYLLYLTPDILRLELVCEIQLRVDGLEQVRLVTV